MGGRYRVYNEHKKTESRIIYILKTPVPPITHIPKIHPNTPKMNSKMTGSTYSQSSQQSSANHSKRFYMKSSSKKPTSYKPLIVGSQESEEAIRKRVNPSLDEACDVLFGACGQHKSHMISLFKERRELYNVAPILTLSDVPYSIQYLEHTGLCKQVAMIPDRSILLMIMRFVSEKVTVGSATRDLGSTRPILLCIGQYSARLEALLAKYLPNVTFIVLEGETESLCELYGKHNEMPPASIDEDGLIIDDYENTLSNILKDTGYNGVDKNGIENTYINMYRVRDLDLQQICQLLPQLAPNIYFVANYDRKYGSDIIPLDYTLQYCAIMTLNPVAYLLEINHMNDKQMVAFCNQKEGPLATMKDFAVKHAQPIMWQCTAEHRGIAFYYLDGNLWIAPWVHRTSTRTYLSGIASINSDHRTTRFMTKDSQGKALIVSREMTINTRVQNTRMWPGWEDYENRMFYYNSIERSHTIHHNPNANRHLGFDCCNDCAVENYILAPYANTNTTVLDIVQTISSTTKTIKCYGHGYLFAPRSTRSLMNADLRWSPDMDEPVILHHDGRNRNKSNIPVNVSSLHSSHASHGESESTRRIADDITANIRDITIQ